MKITRWETVSEEALIAALKGTKLKGHGAPEVYRSASLAIIEQIDPDDLAPAQRYVLKCDLETVAHIRETLLREGIDVLSLRGGVRFWDADAPPEDNPIPVIPPVIEESIEPGGRKVLLINDGMHRVCLARKLGKRINIVLARNVPPQYPYYAFALDDGWAGVVELDELQDGFAKKCYREPQNYKALFRDFNAVLPGVQKQRRRSNPSTLIA